MKGCRPLTAGEVEQIAAAFSGRYAKRDRALFLLGVKTGFRISELLSLEVRDVSPGPGGGVEADPALPGLEAEAAAVLRLGPAGAPGEVTVRRRHMKGKRESRTVVLHPEAKAALEEWIGELHASGRASPRTPLFLSRVQFSGKGKAKAKRAITAMQAHRILQAAFAVCGISGRTGTHCMRKTFAGKVYDSLGKDLIKTQRALGHRNINSTVEYLSFRQEEIDEAVLSS